KDADRPTSQSKRRVLRHVTTSVLRGGDMSQYNAVKSAEGSIPFRTLRFELQRGVGIGTVLVRTRTFVDGLEERSATKGIQIFHFDDAIDEGQRFAPRNGDIPDLDEALQG